MPVSPYIITDPNALFKFKNVLNSFINKHSKNPFFLSGFLKQFLEFGRSKGELPLLLLVSVNNKLVGLVPLRLYQKFGVRYATFLLKNALSPDFVTDDQYRETCIAQTLAFLFKDQKCHFIALTLPSKSQSLQILQDECTTSKIRFFRAPDMGHHILSINNTWNKFIELRKSDYNRKFRRYTRNLNKAGSWKIYNTENNSVELNVFQKILYIERMSWKEKWRFKRGLTIDPDLLMIWNGSQIVARNEPTFKWRVWFLELNNQLLAYCLLLQYKDVAFAMKTSYDERFKRYYPGIYCLNTAIHDLFERGQVTMIDLLSDLSFHRNWTSLCLPRVKVMMSQKDAIFSLMHLTHNIITTIELPMFLKTLIQKAP